MLLNTGLPAPTSATAAPQHPPEQERGASAPSPGPLSPSPLPARGAGIPGCPRPGSPSGYWNGKERRGKSRCRRPYKSRRGPAGPCSVPRAAAMAQRGDSDTGGRAAPPSAATLPWALLPALCLALALSPPVRAMPPPSSPLAERMNRSRELLAAASASIHQLKVCG